MRLDRENAKKKDDDMFLTIDLQQTMPLPKILTSKAFYLRQIWFYNFEIHVVTKNKENTFFCTWTEDVADRGSCEIASALLRFVDTNHNSNQKKDNLVIWSDSCAGQNKNFNMIC
ncbi:unnamed protein product [Pieris macdunnoughi]|uniref:Uncharacterized protein n=1 Tax=Pieris macdunnoughi TaxID=345717 RepID=A0A821XDY1_9NEOP|nr:unnamed protein product [Pieris macdunnoughi]